MQGGSNGMEIVPGRWVHLEVNFIGSISLKVYTSFVITLYEGCVFEKMEKCYSGTAGVYMIQVKVR
jgi:hypothetical protein